MLKMVTSRRVRPYRLRHLSWPVRMTVCSTNYNLVLILQAPLSCPIYRQSSVLTTARSP